MTKAALSLLGLPAGVRPPLVDATRSTRSCGRTSWPAA